MEGTRNIPASSAAGNLFGLSGARLRLLGVILIAVGLGLFILSAVLPFLAMQGFMQDPSGPGGFGSGGLGGFNSIASSFMESFIFGVIGVVLLGVGAYVLRLGLIRPVAGYVASEAAPAIHTVAAALGGGLRDAGFAAPVGPRADVRLKCRNCGYLETEDAEYCSKCGQRM